MGSVGAERRRPTPAQTPEERDVWRDGVRAGWRDVQRESWREGRESSVVQSYSFDSYQLEEEESSKDAPERGVLALSQPGESASVLKRQKYHFENHKISEKPTVEMQKNVGILSVEGLAV